MTDYPAEHGWVSSSHREALLAALGRSGGVLPVSPAIVYRNSYSGHGLFAGIGAADTAFGLRAGYQPVEWWLGSKTEADNSPRVAGEGISQLVLGKDSLLALTEAAGLAEAELFGNFLDRWPLTKILDIGGPKVKPDFSREPEYPPIPPHVHSGAIVDGSARGPGKIEAYFFPPLDVASCSLDLGTVSTRLGLKPRISRQDFLEALRLFGRSDKMYSLLHQYPIAAYDGWRIPAGVVHAPGPWPTVEIQTPQDDFNLAAWQLAQRPPTQVLPDLVDNAMLRGLGGPEDFAQQLVDWNLLHQRAFRDKFFRAAEVLDQGRWGRRLRIFFDEFDGEALEIQPSCRWDRGEDARPSSGFVWSGSGSVNTLSVSSASSLKRELFCAAGHALSAVNSGPETLFLFFVYPMAKAVAG